ncbi:uncharacterized protein I303_106265 [Kwoniella dejecticola CBS 10117]|uniref:Uncharacterized protein n=1 Tax=Kwoniella dejecticola CBS 10117 TaxID=1296121 RepID=A0A1A6A1R1_9TREE|nr:uncharacterized protein I303_06284 [Kwoniella dejecticola CBS 10117]OBR83997.1 hypothetical protein I303_06284 [Kwoniella dejecticola CBS 10117]
MSQVKISAQDQLCRLLDTQKRFSALRPKQRSFSIGPDEGIVAAQGGLVVTAFDRSQEQPDGNGRYRLLAIYRQEFDDTGKRDWTREEYTVDFVPDHTRVLVDMTRDLAVVQELIDQGPSARLRVLSFLEGHQFLLSSYTPFSAQTIRAPTGADHLYRLSVVAPLYLIFVFKFSQSSGQQDSNALSGNHIFIYDIDELPGDQQQSELPPIIDKPTLILKAPDAVQDLPRYAFDPSQIVKDPTISLNVRNRYSTNGILRLSTRIQVGPPSFYRPSQLTWEIGTVILIDELMKRMSTRKPDEVIPLKDWLQFSYIQAEEIPFASVSIPSVSGTANRKLFTITRGVANADCKLTCQDLNQRVFKFEGSLDRPLGGLGQTTNSKEPQSDEIIRQEVTQETSFRSVRNHTRLPTDESCGARITIGEISTGKQSWQSMLSDGERLFILSRSWRSNVNDKDGLQVEILDFTGA